MSNLTNLQETRQALKRLARIVQDTRRELRHRLEAPVQPIPRPVRKQPGQLAEALRHLETVREGFMLSQRTTPHMSPSEIRALIRHILLDWDWLESLDLMLPQSRELEPVRDQLIAFNHAMIALAVLPHLPPEAVTFPQKRPTYADVKTPAVPAELLERIEELERVIYQADVIPTEKPPYGPFRRTYAFFEASAWLVNRYLEALL
ncbi:MAG: hypothetical protein D6784_00740 [Chloroflexi bacterium]|nr:MAG: hypothetical protein D6784_00740 [Chloroflexota bacterium]